MSTMARWPVERLTTGIFKGGVGVEKVTELVLARAMTTTL
jgi:hypothetical protein